VRSPATTRVLAVALLIGAGLLTSLPAQAGSPGNDGSRGVTTKAAPAAAAVLGLRQIIPVSVMPGEVLHLAGTVRNVGAQVLKDTTVQLGTSAVAFATRDQLSADPPATLPVAGANTSLGRIAVGQVRRFRLDVDTDTLPLGGFGVYPLSLTATATVATTNTIVARVDTFLPWAPPDPSVQATRLLWLWPLIDRPVQQASGAFVDDQLAAELAPTGRLGGLVDAARGEPVTWMIDPDLLSSASAMAAGYVVHGRTAEVSKGLGTDVARRWLSDVRAATLGRDVVATAYADPDLTSIAQSTHPSLLSSSSQLGSAVASQVLGRTVLADVAWPDNGQADATLLTKLAAQGIHNVLLSDTVYPPATPATFTPSGRVDLTATGAPTTPDEVAAGTAVTTAALLADSTLNATIDDPATTPDDVLLARQRFLAQTQLITAELPSQSRLVVVAPPRRWDPSPRLATSLLQATDAASWLQPVRLDTALRWPASEVPRSGPVTDPLTQPTLPLGQVDRTSTTLAELRVFRRILTQPVPLATDDLSALYASLSTAWLGTPDDATTWLDDAAATLDDQQSKVRLLTASTATLSSQKGTIPLTVANDLTQAVVVGLQVTSQDPLRVRVTAPALVRVAPQHKQSVDVQVEAVTTGTIPVVAQLTNRVNRPFGAPQRFTVQVRAYGQVAVLVFGTAVALLILAALLRIGRRVVGARSKSVEPEDE
jgi:hypothetical protein